MKESKIPNAASIQELAEFWDTHALTEFEDELEEVTEPVFVRSRCTGVPPESREQPIADKQIALHALQHMSDVATLDEIIEELSILAAIRIGLAAADAGKTVSHAEVKKILLKWIGPAE